MIDKLTKQLFGVYPRQVANPNRWAIYNERGLTDFLMENEGQKECYISVYPHSGSIDKVFLDFDGHPGVCSYEQAFDDSKRVYQTLLDQKRCAVPLASGRKGVHIHEVLQPHKYETPIQAKVELYNTQLQILVDTFGDLEQGTEFDSTGKPVSVYYAIEEDSRVIGCDPVVNGDVQRICRYPNTRRLPNPKKGWANWAWATWLPRDFTSMKWADVIMHCKEPHWDDDIVHPKHAMPDLPKYKGKITVNPMANPKIYEHTFPINTNRYLEKLLRPCLYQALMVSNPLNHARVAATVDLYNTHKPLEIIEIYKGLNWVDFDVAETTRQVYYVKDRYQAYSCRTLKERGFCLYSDRSECPIINGSSLMED